MVEQKAFDNIFRRACSLARKSGGSFPVSIVNPHQRKFLPRRDSHPEQLFTIELRLRILALSLQGWGMRHCCETGALIVVELEDLE
jgi:hypothetical protein